MGPTMHIQQTQTDMKYQQTAEAIALAPYRCIASLASDSTRWFRAINVAKRSLRDSSCRVVTDLQSEQGVQANQPSVRSTTGD